MLSNKEKILSHIQKNGQSSVVELVRLLDIERAMIHRHLKNLLEEGFIEKRGTSPKVLYVMKKDSEREENEKRVSGIEKGIIGKEEEKIIQENFLFITPSGNRQEGLDGFIYWCRDRKCDVKKKAIEYTNIYKKYESFRKNGLIHGTQKFQQTFGKDCAMDDVYYADVYAWEIFGKTKLGQMLLYAKQSQNKIMMREIANIIMPHIDTLLKKYSPDAIGYIPPTIKRSVQFMDELKKDVNIPLPEIKFQKISGEISVPQKSLSKLKDRIENARSNIFVVEKRSFHTVLLIDDAVGSGATFQEVALKLKKNAIAKKVIGFAITGSAKGFDVISEV